MSEAIPYYSSINWWKRINKERDILYKHFKIVGGQFKALYCSSESDNIDKYVSIEIQSSVFKHKKNQTVEFRFVDLDEYPFKKPKLLLDNEQEYDKCLCHHNDYIRKELNEWQANCLCEISILCCNNWSPVLTFKDIINEYIRFYKFIRIATYKRWITLFWTKKELPAVELVDKIVYFM